jgi:hypothetical protein
VRGFLQYYYSLFHHYTCLSPLYIRMKHYSVVRMKHYIAVSFLLTVVATQSTVGPYGQCKQLNLFVVEKLTETLGGGQFYSGISACATGWTCSYVNQYFAQCLVPVTTSTSTVITTSTSSTPILCPTPSLGAPNWGQCESFSRCHVVRDARNRLY